MNESLESGIIPLDYESIQGINFPSISPSEQQQHIKIWKSSRRARPWLRRDCALCLKCPRPLHHSPSIETFHVQTKRQRPFYFALLRPSFSQRVSTSVLSESASRSPPQSGADLSDRLGSAAYINCQRWGLCVFPDQSEACLSSWGALNVLASAGGSTGWFCLSRCLLSWLWKGDSFFLSGWTH